MSALDAVSRAWTRLWFAPSSPYPIAAFRILLGIYLCVYFGALARHVPVEFSREGVYVPYLVPDYAPSPAVAWLLFGALWLCCVALTLGYRAAITIPLLVALFFYHYFLSLAVKHSSFERLVVIYLLALWPARCDRVWALSATHEVPAPRAPIFTARLVRFQTIVLYLGAGLWKAFNPAWQSGVLLQSTLMGVWATPLGFWLVRTFPSQTSWQVGSYLVFGGEILLALLLCFRRTRLLGIALGTLFHLGNVLILSIPEFVVCLAPYVFFVPERAFDRASERLSQET